jgi:hypothetical protein
LAEPLWAARFSGNDRSGESVGHLMQRVMFKGYWIDPSGLKVFN